MSQNATTQEAIALLLDLAERGEIDPWNVDVIDVIDRFLGRLCPDDRQDLQESGQALLYGAMLVQLKANTLDQAAAMLLAEPEPEEEEEALPQQRDGTMLPVHLEQVLQRRPTAPPPKARAVTLAELIAQIEEIALLVEQKAGKPVKNPLRQSKTARKAAMKAIAQLAHKENLTETALALESYLSRHSERILEINELAIALNDRVGVFWGLLLLSAQNKVELFQMDFYGKIYIKSRLGDLPTAPNSLTIDKVHSLVWQEVS
jgi:segregation and condensation protein A